MNSNDLDIIHENEIHIFQFSIPPFAHSAPCLDMSRQSYNNRPYALVSAQWTNKCPGAQHFTFTSHREKYLLHGQHFENTSHIIMIAIFNFICKI